MLLSILEQPKVLKLGHLGLPARSAYTKETKVE